MAHSTVICHDCPCNLNVTDSGNNGIVDGSIESLEELNEQLEELQDQLDSQE